MSRTEVNSPTALAGEIPRIGRALFVLIGLNVILFAAMAWMYSARMVAAEDGPMEDLQLGVLLLAFVFFLIAAVRRNAAARMLCFGLAVFTLVLALREYEPEGSGAIMEYMRSHRFRWHETFVVLGIAVIYALARWRYVPVIARYFLSRASLYFYLAAAMVLCSSVFEKMHLEFFEELFELNGYITHCLMGFFWLSSASVKRTLE